MIYTKYENKYKGKMFLFENYMSPNNFVMQMIKKDWSNKA